MKPRYLLIVVSFLLFLIPFFWLKPGEVDFGGDQTRLYFYDPVNFLKSTSLYPIVPHATGEVRPDFYNIPYFIILIWLKQLLGSPTFLVSLINSMKLGIGFLAVYAIVKEFIGRSQSSSEGRSTQIAAILAGVFYVLSPAVIMHLDRALVSHNQIFLNPLIFYLILRYFVSSNFRYILVALIVSFIFSGNFSYPAAPAFFSFYPLSLLFLFLYTKLIQKKTIPVRGVIVGLFLFIGLHAFHLFPEIIGLFNPQSSAYTILFNKESMVVQENYFLGVLPIAKLSLGVFAQAPFYENGSFTLVIPFVIALGFLLNKKRDATIILVGIFFLVALFFHTAKVANITVEFYSRLFYIPGFSMFRNFWVQWVYVYGFFYALLFGLALSIIFSKLQKKIILFLFSGLMILIFINGWPIISGSIVNQTLFQSNGVKTAQVFDPNYEETLAFIRSLPREGKVLVLPFSDCCNQVIHGVNNGAYVGVSTIGYLTGKKDFSGHTLSVPFSDSFFQLAKAKDYVAFKQMLGLLNIRYIFYNSDPRIYDTTFPDYPYSPNYARKHFPNEQRSYGDFVKNISKREIFTKGPYSLYELDKEYFLPRFYIPERTQWYEDNPTYDKYGIYGKSLSFFPPKDSEISDIRTIYVNKKTCESGKSLVICNQRPTVGNGPEITFVRINPTKYKINVSRATSPFILVFSEAFHKDWKIFVSSNRNGGPEVIDSFFDGTVKEGRHKNIFFDANTFETLDMKPLAENVHFMVNAYANAWYVKPQDFERGQEHELIVELTTQRLFYGGLILSTVTFLASVLFGTRFFLAK